MHSVAFAASGEQALVELEAKWSKAYPAKDTRFMDSIVAPDWVMQSDGPKVTKTDLLGDVKSGKLSITAMANHDVHARIFGDVAVVQGADKETSSYAGKDTSGEYTWTDVFQNRNGKWMAVASQVTKKK